MNVHHGDGATLSPTREQLFESTASIEAYEQAWADTQCLTPDEMVELACQSVHFSADLMEVTYTIPFGVMDAKICH